jgi:hypothetical protein
VESKTSIIIEMILIQLSQSEDALSDEPLENYILCTVTVIVTNHTEKFVPLFEGARSISAH